MYSIWQQLLPASWKLILFLFFFCYFLKYKKEQKFSMQLHLVLRIMYAIIFILSISLFVVEKQHDFLSYATFFMSLLTIVLMEVTLSGKEQNELDLISVSSCCILPIFISLMKMI
ncbi:DUF1516 domain-containing protein [Priestia megaterium]|uniref:DUF1516 domain-containing protein n=1 Tax=Priestia megaterium TaxID=1404 RepID=A0A3D8WSV9_PRIMG|nr:DUF1516 family protein [Priestia megaterium]MDH3169013.1 DUF1516 family protein [Priestia megaterium]RDZ05023.1 DUF1516 domain-containing protein [Priestia megaterium]